MQPGVYIILGIFFGAVGIHNFYAGHLRRGTAQLLLTLFGSFLVLPLIGAIIWALLDVCTVTTDGDDQPMY